MKLLGRKLVMNWGNSNVSIEILSGNPYNLPERGSMLYNIVDFLGERTEQKVGVPQENPYGRDLNSCVPGHFPYGWLTEGEQMPESDKP